MASSAAESHGASGVAGKQRQMKRSVATLFENAVLSSLRAPPFQLQQRRRDVWMSIPLFWKALGRGSPGHCLSLVLDTFLLLE